jgi:tRNA-intron endonuclease
MIRMESEVQVTVEAFFSNGKIFIPLSDRLTELRERGFGTLKGKKIVLSCLEAFYLVDKKRIDVIRNDGTKVEFRDIVRTLSKGRPEVWMRYLVYRDLRDRGYIVREEKKVDFEIYGKGAVRRLVSIVYEGQEASIKALSRLTSFALQEKKELILAVIDRRTDIVYYTLGKQSF